MPACAGAAADDYRSALCVTRTSSEDSACSLGDESSIILEMGYKAPEGFLGVVASAAECITTIAVKYTLAAESGQVMARVGEPVYSTRVS